MCAHPTHAHTKSAQGLSFFFGFIIFFYFSYLLPSFSLLLYTSGFVLIDSYT